MTPRSLEEVATPAVEEGAPTPLRPPASVAECVTAPAPSSDSHQIPDDAYPLALRGLHKRWRKDLPPVLDGLDLTLDLGTRTWVGGRNGAGKTTLLRIAAGLIDPDRGRAEVWGYSARENRVRYQQVVSFLPAGDRGLYARLTVRRQLEFWARIAMIAPARVAPAVGEAIDTFELSELADRRVDRLSMGQRQRLRIAMTFLPSPEVVLLDEPLTSLDAEGAAVLNRAIEDTIARHGAVLWCSPSGEQLDQSFDARWMLEDGRLTRI
jgi:ABC-2 type transport system ATP-binding protein